MENPAVKEKKSGLIPKLIIILCLPLLIAAVLYLVLFVWNRFSIRVELVGQESVTMSAGDEFPDPGVKVKLFGTLFLKNGTYVKADVQLRDQVNTELPGSYIVIYDADWHGLRAFASRSVVVLDSRAPAITLVSDPEHYTIYGEVYEEEGYSAWDDCDGDLTDQVIRRESDGYVTYTVSDQMGNTTSVSRKIYYYDPIAPELTLIGDGTVYVNAGTVYKDDGCTAVDNVDGDISRRIEVSGTVDKYLAGTYRLTYTVSDSTGNAAEIHRDVIVQGKTLNDTVTPEGNVIYLTFDDGPGPYTRDLLEILEKYDVKATFFVVDSDYNHLLQEIVDGGHAIGIHSVSHNYKTIYASPDAFFSDILSMQQIIYDETGVKTYLMRFPGGSSNTVSRFNEGIMTYLTQAVEDNGFRYFDWNVDSNDAGGARDDEEVFDNVTGGVSGRRVSIVLQHDVKAFSVEAVEQIILWGLENGYKFLPLDMTSPMAHHGVNN